MRYFDSWALRLLSKPLRDLDERLERLERAVKQANLDWDDLYEKTRRAQGRMDARDRGKKKDTNGEQPDLADFDAVNEAIREGRFIR